MDWLTNIQTAYGGWFANTQDFEIVKHFFSAKMQADIAEWMIKIAVVWVLMGRRVAEWARTTQANLQVGVDLALKKFGEHTQVIEQKLAEVVTSVDSLKSTVAQDFSEHTKLINHLNIDMELVKKQIFDLKQQRKET